MRGVISNEVSNVFIYIGFSNSGIFIPPSIVLRYDEDGWDAANEQMSRVRILKRL